VYAQVSDGKREDDAGLRRTGLAADGANDSAGTVQQDCAGALLSCVLHAVRHGRMYLGPALYSTCAVRSQKLAEFCLTSGFSPDATVLSMSTAEVVAQGVFVAL
jgi:hypothetical protein